MAKNVVKNLRTDARANYLISQKYAVVNDAIADALGKNGSITELDSTGLVNFGSQLEDMGLLEGFFWCACESYSKDYIFCKSIW